MDRGKQKLIRDTLDDLRREASSDIIPVYPYILVYVLGHAGRAGRIILPDKQNKVLYEALVVKVFEEKLLPSGVIEEAAVDPGEHILFRHYQGIPVPIDNFGGDFRLIENKEVAAVIDYNEFERATAVDELFTFVPNNETLRRMLERFIFVDRQTQHATLSGR